MVLRASGPDGASGRERPDRHRGLAAPSRHCSGLAIRVAGVGYPARAPRGSGFAISCGARLPILADCLGDSLRNR
jgi:hypothetical protein